MKKRIIIPLIALILLCAGSLTVYGDEILVSLRYLNEEFRPSLAPAVTTVGTGQCVSLSEGQSFMLLSGNAEVYTSGTLVNATSGAEAPDGVLRPYSRYIVCEDSSADILALDECEFMLPPDTEEGSHAPVPSPSPVPGGNTVSPFTDVKEGDWFYSDVISAYDRGLVNGMTVSTYAPDGTLTAAQCVKLAACMHQLWHSGAVTLKNSPSGLPWYRSYADYALENGILYWDFEDYDAVISRRDFVQIFFRALPMDCYAPINSIGSIPDVTEYIDPAAGEIYAFYRAGILTGYSGTAGMAEHTFSPESSISRAEVATIMNRMFDESARKQLYIP